MIDSTPTLWDKVGREVLGWIFVELPGFSDWRDDYFESDDEFALLQIGLAQNPTAGDVIPGCGGLRKLLWRDPRRGKGKRGGLRIIYLLVPEAQAIAFAWVYDKNEAEDLTAAQKREAQQFVHIVRQGLLKKRRAKGH